MPIPDYQSIMLPLLELAKDRKEHAFREAIQPLADHFKLSPEERNKRFSSGRMAIFDNRVGWALSYLKGAGLLRSTRRGFFEITERGIDALRKNPSAINNDFLKQYKEFHDFLNKTKTQAPSLGEKRASTATEDQSPLDLLETGYQKAKDLTLEEILDQVIKCSSSFFEELVMDLLLKMGYGNGDRNAAKVTGRSGDGGIDGIIYGDALGLDLICFQAKKYAKDQSIGSQVIRDFLGALDQNGFVKGILITTSSFREKAATIESKTGKRIVLIDGRRLAELMWEYGLGVTTKATYQVKRIDTDYFEEEVT